mmetsp:Transcript_281/g.996  ORF Transcript_281/g.996 Transcript_281/m.996 type:complete len:285 (+) Transcript_281:3405-4259(+)
MARRRSWRCASRWRRWCGAFGAHQRERRRRRRRRRAAAGGASTIALWRRSSAAWSGRTHAGARSGSWRRSTSRTGRISRRAGATAWRWSSSSPTTSSSSPTPPSPRARREPSRPSTRARNSLPSRPQWESAPSAALPSRSSASTESLSAFTPTKRTTSSLSRSCSTSSAPTRRASCSPPFAPSAASSSSTSSTTSAGRCARQSSTRRCFAAIPWQKAPRTVPRKFSSSSSPIHEPRGPPRRSSWCWSRTVCGWTSRAPSRASRTCRVRSGRLPSSSSSRTCSGT